MAEESPITLESFSIIWSDPSAFPEEALTFAATDDARVWVFRGRRPAENARYYPREVLAEMVERISWWITATSNCPECDHPRSAHYQSTDWGSGCLLAVDSETGVHRCECKGLDGRGPRILVSTPRTGSSRSWPAVADDDRCVHGRCRIDPCLGCGRCYEDGELVGPFIKPPHEVSMREWLRAIDEDAASS